jgi:hypothetical protein
MTAPGFVPPPATGWWVKRNMVPFPLPAALLLTGASPFVRLGPKLTPTGASLALTGATPLVLRGPIVLPAASSLVLTGSVPTIRGGPKVLPSAAALTLAGGTPRIGPMFDSVATGDDNVNGFINSLNIAWTHTATGTERAVLVGFTSNNVGQSPASQTKSVTYDGSPMSQLITVDVNSDTFIQIWGLLNPPTGAKTVSVTISQAANTGRQLIGSSVSYTRVNSFGATSSNTGSGTALTQTVSSSSAEKIFQVFGCFALQSAYNQTLRVTSQVPANNADVLLGDANGAASVNFASTGSLSGAWAGAAVRLIP